MRAVFSWSYRQLPPPAARLFRLVGLHPAAEVHGYPAAEVELELAALAGPPAGVRSRG